MTAHDGIDFLKALRDPHKGKSLNDIPIISERVLSIIIRNKSQFINKYDFIAVKSTIQIVEGIEYHYKNFVNLLETFAAQKEVLDDSPLDHEAVAYLNRLGQLRFFLWSKNLLDMCPKINELYLFRKKNTAHLSIHAPRDESESEQIWQAGALERRCWRGDVSTLSQYEPDPKRELEELAEFLTPRKYLSKKALISYQILSNGTHADFIPQKDHPIILTEIEVAYKKLFSLLS